MEDFKKANELCDEGLNKFPNQDFEVRAEICSYKAWIHHHLFEKNIENYKVALNFYKATLLEHQNLAEAQKGEHIVNKVFECLLPLLYDPSSQGFDESCQKCPENKEVSELIDKIASNPAEYKCREYIKDYINMTKKLYENKLTKKDSVIEKRAELSPSYL